MELAARREKGRVNGMAHYHTLYYPVVVKDGVIACDCQVFCLFLGDQHMVKWIFVGPGRSPARMPCTD
jgi:hypothetical protein